MTVVLVVVISLTSTRFDVFTVEHAECVRSQSVKLSSRDVQDVELVLKPQYLPAIPLGPITIMLITSRGHPLGAFEDDLSRAKPLFAG